MMKILWLCSWYPNKEQNQNGDFIQRLAQSASLYDEITTLSITRVQPSTISNKQKEIMFSKAKNLEEIIVMYSQSQKLFFNKFLSNLKYLKFHFQAYRNYKKKNGLPDIIHVQVAWKAGIAALLLKKIYNIPYVITEHWTQYLDGAEGEYAKKSVIYRYVTKKIFQNADQVIAVSEMLKNRLDYLMQINCTVIPNVVNKQRFSYRDKKDFSPITFVHISSMADQKNPIGILEAFQRLNLIYRNVKLIMVGPNERFLDTMESYSNVDFIGQVDHDLIPEILNNSDATIIFSYYETFCCVIPEALNCGVPVISTKVGIAQELIVDGENGFLIEQNVNQLFERMKTIIDFKFDKEQIASKYANLYSYETTGLKTHNLYMENVKHI